MRIRYIQKILLIFTCFIAFACKDDPNDVVTPRQPGAGDQEVITTLLINCVGPGNDTVRAKFRDSDGSIGSQWILDSLKLKANTAYTAHITLYDESIPGRSVDITREIEEEKDYHQFFFESPGMNLTTAYLDKDSKDMPVGLRFTINTGAAASGLFIVKLSHFAHDQVKDGVTPKGGTDIYVEFPSRVY